MANRIRRSGFPRQSQSNRRKTEWLASADITGVTALGASAAILDQSRTINDPQTIVRTRGTLWVESDQVIASEEPFGALGMSVVSTPAATAGILSVPAPITEEGDDSFFLWMPWQAALNFRQATAASVNIWNGWSRYDFDSKAQRKATDGDSLVVTLENANSAHGLFYILKFRQLIMLH